MAGELVVVDNTILSDVALCHTRGALKHVLGLTARAEAVELRAGQAVHAALARLLYAGKTTSVSVGAALDVFDRHYREWVKGVQLPDDRYAWQHLRAVLALWMKRHPIERWPFVVEKGDIEVAVRLPLPGVEGVEFVGLIDALVRKKTGGGWWVLDHKTAKRLDAWWRSHQEVSSQFTGYSWGAEETRGIHVSGAVVNGVGIPKVYTSSAICRDHKVAYRECGLQHAEAEYKWVSRGPQEVAAWLMTAQRVTREYLRLRKRVESIDDIRTVAMQGRFKYGACGNCFAKAWCAQGRPVKRVKAVFKVDRWDPIAHAGLAPMGVPAKRELRA